MKRFRLMALGVAVLALMAVSVPPVLADDDDDPPGRVARLNYSDGSVSFQPGGEGDWITAVPNRPLTTGDNLWADKDSRAELHVGSTAIRMDSETSLTFLDLDDRTTQLRLSQGSLIIRLRHLDDGDTFEVDTPNLAFSLLRTGEYRVDVNAEGDTTIATVWRGRGEVTGGGDSFVVIGGQQARFTGAEELDHEIAQIPPSDDFVKWAFERDQREDKADSANYISTEVTGYEDLDDYGRWHYVADYGPVWTPVQVAVGWAPYRYGHWVWIAPWGWTWVEDEPWGFAPFHYGRWAYLEGGWCWVPGPVVVRPVYAPALVAFVGGGGFHVSVSIGGGPGVAWFPLAPGEVYVPAYRVSRAYVNNVNITNTRVSVTQVTNIYNVYNTNTGGVTRVTYVNQRVTNGVTVVSHDTFVNARPVARNIVRVDEREIVSAPVTHSVEVQPVRASWQGAGTPVRFRPPTTINRPVVARTPLPAHVPGEPRPVPGNARQAPEQTQPMGAGPSGMPRPETGIRRANNPESLPAPSSPPPESRPVPRPQPQLPVEHPMSAGTPAPLPPQQERPVPRPNWGGDRPVVKPAPPVQERGPQQQQNEENKFRKWEQQRPQRPAPAQASQPQERHVEAPKPAPRQAPKPSDSHSNPHSNQRPNDR